MCEDRIGEDSIRADGEGLHRRDRLNEVEVLPQDDLGNWEPSQRQDRLGLDYLG